MPPRLLRPLRANLLCLAHRPVAAHASVPIPARAPCARHARTPVAIALFLALGTDAGAETLAEVLAAVTAAARAETPEGADVTITCDRGCRTSRAILLDRGDTRYVEVKDGPRALLSPGRLLVAKDGKVSEGPLDARLGDSGVLLCELTIFRADSLALPQISDDGPAGLVVTAAPARPSPYVLLVLTIDRGRHAIAKTQYYRGSIGHLARLRRDAGWVELRGRWRPREVTFEDLDEKATTRLSLSWRAAPEAPAVLFEPAGLERSSALTWP